MPDLYIRELESRFAEAWEAIKRVRAIHARNTYHPHYCRNCRAPWPCRTIRALDGDGAS